MQTLEEVLDASIGDSVISAIRGLRLLTLDGERLCITDRQWQMMRTQLADAIGAFHQAQPLAPGMEMEDARAQISGRVTPRVFRALVDRFAAEGAIARDANILRLPTHTVRLTSVDQALSATLASLLGTTPWSPPDLADLTAASGAAKPAVVDMLRVMERNRTVVRASPDVYFLRDAVDRVKATLKERLPPRGTVTPAALRDLLQTSRKYVIPLLELLDREGVTIRIGDTRRLR